MRGVAPNLRQVIVRLGNGADQGRAEAVRRDLALGLQLKVRGTPTFLVGYREGGGTEVRVVRRIVGAQPLDAFETAINGALARTQGSMAALP